PSPDQIKKRIEEAGIVGMGGAGFPTHMKLSPPKPVDIAFLNGCECEPFLTADERLMVEESRKVVEGFVLLKKAEGAKKGIIGIESDKKEAIQKITESISNYDDLEIAVLPKVYPQGYEKMLITETTGRRVPAGGLPFDAGVAVHNVSTSFAVAEAVYEGRPLMERVLTVSGDNIIEPVNFRAPLGMKVKEILSYCSRGSLENKKLDIYMGGPMMGVSLDSLEQGILKTTSGIIVGEAFSRNEAPCIKCGRCVNTCPMGLSPRMLNMFYEGRSFDNMLRRGLESCMECGCCSYICPSDISLREKFRDAKNHI
ncbi:MAG: RnfABCDGE type electron transport complex subunit C, partial [Elusimicrobiota bacterium]